MIYKYEVYLTKYRQYKLGRVNAISLLEAVKIIKKIYDLENKISTIVLYKEKNCD